MSDEEKKAIEIIKFLQYKCIEENGTGMMPIYRIDDLANAIKIILNLIEKQQNEIEELKNADLTTVYLNGVYDGEKKVQDKIKAKIEEIKNECKYCDFTDEICQELLQNNNCTQGNTLIVLQSLLEKEKE